MALFFTILYSYPRSVIYPPLAFSIPSKRVLMQVLCESPVLRVPLGKLGMQQISVENTWLTHTQK